MYRSSNKRQPNRRQTSWQGVSNWYSDLVGADGQYFHSHIIVPKLKELVDFNRAQNVLDLACGQGFLANYFSNSRAYVGIDLASDLINIAKRNTKNKNAKFFVSDITKPLSIDDTKKFDLSFCILALQNVDDIEAVFKNAAKFLKPNGQFILVINHPYFRIPRLTSWGIDEQSKQQYRKVYKYMSSQSVPIDMNPGSGGSKKFTWSFHKPLKEYTNALKNSGFVITNLDEWTSDKTSVGKASKMENRARNEFPMFMCIVAKKN